MKAMKLIEGKREGEKFVLVVFSLRRSPAEGGAKSCNSKSNLLKITQLLGYDRGGKKVDGETHKLAAEFFAAAVPHTP